MIPSPENTRIVKIAKKVFRYDNVMTDWGWKHDMYYDVESKSYLIADFPTKDMFFELSICPEDGLAEIQVHGETHRVRVYEE